MKKELSHRDKLKLARRHMGQGEIRDKVPPFNSRFWTERKKQIAERVENYGKQDK